MLNKKNKIKKIDLCKKLQKLKKEKNSWKKKSSKND